MGYIALENKDLGHCFEEEGVGKIVRSEPKIGRLLEAAARAKKRWWIDWLPVLAWFSMR